MAAAAHGDGPHRGGDRDPVPVQLRDPAAHDGGGARGARALTAITTVAMLPLLVIVLSTTLELGSLRVVAARVRSAADLAALVAVNDQDDGELARTGRLVPASDAADVARALFAANLDPIA